ncbi:hypothetical protein FHX77_000017 [Bifidobacterium commune]|uniref:Uncharacterized protein n=1 Tax=Bifidobacterium commune TaxID=1505727 RepID=A0A1C4H0J8_9BIFI|nr:hypothetical protein [Bifidobacterium commune]SCC78453.1 hypothetical protein GA0061077_0268 [Bifidobacterium commune]
MLIVSVCLTCHAFDTTASQYESSSISDLLIRMVFCLFRIGAGRWVNRFRRTLDEPLGYGIKQEAERHRLG